MNPFIDKTALVNRTKHKLRYRYARWLAKHKPECFCYRPAWRNFWRKSRRVASSLHRLLGGKRYFTFVRNVLLGVGTIVGAVFLAVLLFACLAYSSELLRENPGRAKISSEVTTEIAFARLTLMQYWFVFLSVVLGLSYRNGRPDDPRPQFVARDQTPRIQLIALRVIASGAILLTLPGAIHCPTTLPFYARSLLATGIAGVTVAAACYWLGRWLARIHVPNRHDWYGTGMFMMGMFVVGGSILLMMDPRLVDIAQELAWWGPVGWLNAQAMEIGRGSMAAGWLWGLGIVVCGLVTFQLRRQVRSPQHWRKVLTDEAIELPPEESSIARSNVSQVELALQLREKIQAYPTTWHRWLVPHWLREEWTLIAIAAVLTCLVQGVAIGFHWWFERIQADGGLGEGESLLLPFDEIIALAAMGLMMWSVEVMGMLVDDQQQLREIQRRPVSVAQLWRTVQWHGLVRTPAILLGVLPFLVVPLYLTWDRPWIPFLMIGVALSSMIATRTGIVASVLAIVGVTLLPAWLLWLAIVYFYVPAAVVIYAMYSSMPDFMTSGLTLPFRQLSAHLLAILLLGIGCVMWHWYGKLPSEITARPTAQKKTAASE
ncbi:hypothetical protein DTL42_23360 [Bremerella cremea]|uniref:Uncharacterized protein n=1 Tax=Bremerella cremea TaxID=1031537 RepID=A0A368KNS1_9BACT|nr:hypothetical protein [Bremerella cremea]RCS41492.1 hypothetical protein DTL42_23360 [Bremerella cremea]